MITPEISSLAQKLWDYHRLKYALTKADCILVLGSHDLRVAERAADIYLEGWAPLIIMSGGLGNLTQNIWTEPEANKFAAVALKRGVPESAILIENRSTNTGENILFTQQLLKEKGIVLNDFILVQKPYMERRSFATFKTHWPEKNIIVTSPQITFENYPTDIITIEKVINIMTGDLQRIKIYPSKGFQIYQPIPTEIWDAFERLVELGFNKHLIKE
jgi:uncharacterized SAM-binding protein YcdF (DUF218 family)